MAFDFLVKGFLFLAQILLLKAALHKFLMRLFALLSNTQF
jgi:hypothetical protein